MRRERFKIKKVLNDGGNVVKLKLKIKEIF